MRTISALDDLHWLCNSYHAEVGIRSGFGTFQNILSGIHVSGSRVPDIRWSSAIAAGRASRIIRAVCLLTHRNRKVILHSYDPPPRMPKSYIANYGDELSGIVWKMRPPAGVKGQQAVRSWARGRLDRAHDQYLLEKRGVDNMDAAGRRR